LKYFDIRKEEEDVGKAKSFYDLLVMARIEKLKLKNASINGRFSDMKILSIILLIADFIISKSILWFYL